MWARDLVRQIIASRLGVRFFLLSVGRVMHQLGMSPQRPLHRAWQSDPAAVAAWQQQVYPGIAADMKTRGATIHFGDEVSVRSDFHPSTTWVLAARNPIARTTGARFRMTMISAVSAQGDSSSPWWTAP